MFYLFLLELLFFFLIIPHQPRSTLFPYTTLFRSLLVGSLLGGALLIVVCDITMQLLLPYINLPLNALTALVGAPVVIDRKSTRLNSSHVRISYAVFCLKKKK